MAEDTAPTDDPNQPTPDRTVTIRITGRIACTSVEFEPLLASALQYSLTEFHSSHGNVGRRRSDVRIYEVLQDLLVFSAGQLRTVQQILESAGCSVTVEHVPLEQSPLLEPYRPTVDEADDVGRSFLAAVDRESHGIITLPLESSAAPWIALIVKWFRRARVIIPVPTVQMMEDLERQIFPYYACPLGRISSKHNRSDERVTLVTYQAFRNSEAQNYQLVIFPEAETMPRNVGTNAIDSAWFRYENHRIYGFVQDRQPSESIQARLQIYFGNEIFAVPHPRSWRSTVHVELIRYTASPLMIDDAGLERKRATIWHNAARNAAIAEVAQALAERDIQRLWRNEIMLQHEEGYLEEILGPFRTGIVILVESTEHANQLVQLLPNWQICSGTDTRPVIYGNSIMTMIHGNRLGCLPSNVIVRADGDAGPVPLGDFPPDVSSGGPQHVLLVDLAEEDDDVARAASYARLADYRARGFELDARSQRLLAVGPPTRARGRRR